MPLHKGLFFCQVFTSSTRDEPWCFITHAQPFFCLKSPTRTDSYVMHNYQYVFLVPCYLPTPSHNQHILFADFSWAHKFPRCSHLQLHLSQLKLVDVKLFFCCNYGIHGFSQVRINKWTFIQEMLIQSWTWRPILPEHSSDWDSSPLTFHPSGKLFPWRQNWLYFSSHRWYLLTKRIVKTQIQPTTQLNWIWG